MRFRTSANPTFFISTSVLAQEQIAAERFLNIAADRRGQLGNHCNNRGLLRSIAVQTVLICHRSRYASDNMHCKNRVWLGRDCPELYKTDKVRDLAATKAAKREGIKKKIQGQHSFNPRLWGQFRPCIYVIPPLKFKLFFFGISGSHHSCHREPLCAVYSSIQ